MATTVQVSLIKLSGKFIIQCHTGLKGQPRYLFSLDIDLAGLCIAKATREERQKVVVAYDNMCHLDGLKVVQEPLPLPGYLQLENCRDRV